MAQWPRINVLRRDGHEPMASGRVAAMTTRNATGTPHLHRVLVDGCYRCDLNRDELEAAHDEYLREAREVIAKHEDGHFRDGISPGYQALVFDLLDQLVGIVEYRQSR